MRPRKKRTALFLALLLAALPCLTPLAAADDLDDDAGSGSGVGVQVMSKILESGRFDLGATLELLTDPDTLWGAAGGIVGFQVAAKLSSMFLPPGAGIFVQMLPRFLGGALGFELARGRLYNIDPVAMTVQAFASAGGYALFHALLGATAPGWALMIGASLFGLAANLLIRKKPEESETPQRFLTKSIDGSAESTVDTPEVAAAPGTSDLVTAREQADEAYQDLVEGVRSPSDALPELFTTYQQAQLHLAGLRAR